MNLLVKTSHYCYRTDDSHCHLRTDEVWNPTDLYKIDMPEPLKEKQKEQAIKQAKKLLTREGIISESQLAS